MIDLNALGIKLIININNLLTSVNSLLDLLIPWTILIFIIGYNVHFYNKNKKKQDTVRMVSILILIEAVLIAVFWFVPFLFRHIHQAETVLRWVLFILAAMWLAYFYGHENGEKRWFFSAVVHIGAVLFGWWVNRWMGIFFISTPLLLIYYSMLYILAMVVLPASNPEDGNERWKRFIVLASYTWGFQFPILVVPDHAWRGTETRIKGDFTRDFKVPGVIWSNSHQVVGITGGTQFNRVDGPGIIFTGKLEQPLEVIDLRLQIRSNKIEVISKDGIRFNAVVFAAFRMDHKEWDNKAHARLRSMNPLLQDAKEISHTIGSFPFSHRRIQSTLSVVNAEKLGVGEVGSKTAKVIPWDQWAMNIINEETRKIASQKTLNEFWRPIDDKEGASAMDEIAEEVTKRSEWTLRSKGILLVASRVVSFIFSPEKKEEMDDISKQQIAAWGAEWERKRAQKLADAEAEAERNQQEARAYAESQLLNSIAEALKKTDDPNNLELRRHIIAMRYLSALQDYAHKNTPEEEEQIKELHDSIRGQ
jgi:hypothetical protein